jgi:hypothetical protein
MAESSAHQILVERLVQWMQRNISNSDIPVVLVDSPTTTAGNKPPAIGGYNPDVFCRTIGREHVLIGEAKTAGDIENKHSRDQFRAFLVYLKQFQSGTLVVAVPWRAVGQVMSLIRFLQRETDTVVVKTVFLDKLPG